MLTPVAKYSATDGARYLVTISKQVWKCKRNKEESFARFAPRYRGIAQTYLNHCHSANVVQDTENLATNLLQNALLSTSAFNNIFSLLVADAKERIQNEQVICSLPKEMFGVLESDLALIRGNWDKNKSQLPPINRNNDVGANTAIRIDNHITSLTNDIANVKQRASNAACMDRTKYMISLDEAVTALKDIKTEVERV